jgi:hypothetical protein
MPNNLLIAGSKSALNELVAASMLKLSAFHRLVPERSENSGASPFHILDVDLLPTLSSDSNWDWWENLAVAYQRVAYLNLATSTAPPLPLVDRLRQLENWLHCGNTTEYLHGVQLNVIHVDTVQNREGSEAVVALSNEVLEARKEFEKKNSLACNFFVMAPKLDRGGTNEPVFRSCAVWPLSVGRLLAFLYAGNTDILLQKIPMVYAWRHLDIISSQEKADAEKAAEVKALEHLGSFLRDFSAQADPLPEFVKPIEFRCKREIAAVKEIADSDAHWAFQDSIQRAEETISPRRASDFLQCTADAVVPEWETKRSEWLSALGSKAADLQNTYLIRGGGSGFFALENHLQIRDARSEEDIKASLRSMEYLNIWSSKVQEILKKRQETREAAELIQTIQNHFLAILWRTLVTVLVAVVVGAFAFRLAGSSPGASGVDSWAAGMGGFCGAFLATFLLWMAENAAGKKAWQWFKEKRDAHDSALQAFRDILADTFDFGLTAGDFLKRRSLLGRFGVLIARFRAILSARFGGLSDSVGDESLAWDLDGESTKGATRRLDFLDKCRLIQSSDKSKRTLEEIIELAEEIAKQTVKTYFEKFASDSGDWTKFFSKRGFSVLRRDFEIFLGTQFGNLHWEIISAVEREFDPVKPDISELKNSATEAFRNEDHPRRLSFPQDPCFEERKLALSGLLAEREALRCCGLIDPVAVQFWPAKTAFLQVKKESL